MKTSYGLVRDIDFFRNQKDVNILTQTKAIKIDRNEKRVRILNVNSGLEDTIPYDFLVLATGAKPSIPPIPGVNLSQVFTLHHPHDAQKHKELIKAKKVNKVEL